MNSVFENKIINFQQRTASLPTHRQWRNSFHFFAIEQNAD